MDNIPRTNHTPARPSWGLTWPLTWGTSHGLASTDDYSFYLPLLGSIVPSYAAGSSTPTFTRATVSATTDFEGLIKACVSGESRFYGLRRVRNRCVNSFALNNAAWSAANVTYSTGISDPAGGTSAYTITASAPGGVWYDELSATTTSSYRNSIWLRRRTGSGTISIHNPNAGTTNVTSQLTTEWQRFASSITGPSGSPFHVIGVAITTSGDAVDIWRPMAEEVTGQSNQNPSEYVSIGELAAPLHGCGTADGIKYFTTENNNTVASNVVTEATGSAIATATMLGYMAEGARTNRCLHNRFNTFVSGDGSSGGNLNWVSSAYTGTAELITNGTFPTDITGWTQQTGATIAWNAGVPGIDVTTTAGYLGAEQAFTCTVGETYILTLTVSGANTGRIYVAEGSGVASARPINRGGLASGGTYTLAFTATATTHYLVLSSDTAVRLVTYSNISIKRAKMRATANSVASPDGATTACTLLANEANATLIQDMGTVSSAAKAWGVWMKRKTGTGNVELTMDNGATWTTVTVTSSWTLVQMSQTLANEDVGIRIVTSGDEVYVWNGQVETPTTGAAVISSPIGPVTTTSVTRNSDSLTYAQSGNISLTVGTLYAEVAALYTSVSAYAIGGNGTSGMYFGTDAPGPYLTTTVGLWDGTNATVKSGLTSNLNTTYKYAVSYTGTTALITGQGASAQAGTFDGSLSSGSLIVGSTAAGSIGYTVRNATIYPTADNAAALQARTT